MRRVWIVLTCLALAAVPACGRKSYEDRLSRTLAGLDKDRRIRKNLMEPPSEKKFQDLGIYVRPPKEELLAKAGQLPVTEGQFDLDASFLDKTDPAALHVLARVKLPKKAPTKGAPPPPPPAARGNFETDVLGVLPSLYGLPEGLQTPKFVEENKGSNRFRRLSFTSADREVRVYTYKQDTHEVALVFAYAPSLRGPIATKIDLCLEAFAAGEKARRLYSGGAAEEDAEAGAPVPL